MSDEELDALIEAVDAGTATGRIGNLCADTLLTEHMIDIGKANAGSLDAAKALHEALLPGWDYRNGRDGDDYHALVFRCGRMDEHAEDWQMCPSNPARAWLLAVLKAYRTQVTK